MGVLVFSLVLLEAVKHTFLKTIGIIVVLSYIVDSMWSSVEYVGSWLTPFFQPNAVLELTQRFGPWAVVTGSTDGIGKAYATELARRGLNLVLISRNLEKLRNVAQEIEKKYSAKTKVIVADFSQGDGACYEHIADELKNLPVGILVNNVGCNYEYPMPVCEVPPSKAWELINVNVGAVTMVTRVVLPAMVARGRGAVVNVSSGAENQPLPLMAIYAATKAYIKSFTAALREEYSSQGIYVQRLSPYFVTTKMNEFSPTLMKESLLVPSVDKYARHAVATLGRSTDTTGYWMHGLQCSISKLVPTWCRVKVGAALNRRFRDEHLRKV